MIARRRVVVREIAVIQTVITPSVVRSSPVLMEMLELVLYSKKLLVCNGYAAKTLLITRSSHPCMHRPSHRVSKVQEKKLLSASKK